MTVQSTSTGISVVLKAAEKELTDLARPICSVFNRSTKKYEFEDEHIAKVLPGTFEVIQQIRVAVGSVDAAQGSQEPAAWRYKCKDGSEVLMLKRLTDEQKRRGYYTGEDGEDEVEGDEAIVGPFHWAEETPLYAAPQPASNAYASEDSDDWKALAWDKVAEAHETRRARTIEECARYLETSYPDHAWLNAACAAIRSLSVTSTTRGPAA